MGRDKKDTFFSILHFKNYNKNGFSWNVYFYAFLREYMLYGKHSNFLRAVYCIYSRSCCYYTPYCQHPYSLQLPTLIDLSSEKFKQDLQTEVHLFTEHIFEARL